MKTLTLGLATLALTPVLGHASTRYELDCKFGNTAYYQIYLGESDRAYTFSGVNGKWISNQPNLRTRYSSGSFYMFSPKNCGTKEYKQFDFPYYSKNYQRCGNAKTIRGNSIRLGYYQNKRGTFKLIHEGIAELSFSQFSRVSASWGNNAANAAQATLKFSNGPKLSTSCSVVARRAH